ncbi:MAG: hypothetical protein ACREV7_08330 [Steroidobacteraceae bacterium]
MVYEWLLAEVYQGLIVQTFGGVSEAHLTSTLQAVISYFITAIACVACSLYCSRRSGPSRVIVVIHLVGVVVPLQALIAARYEFESSAFASVVALAYVTALALAAMLPQLTLAPTRRTGRVILIVAAALMTLYLYGALLAGGGISRINFDLASVYKVRAAFLENAAPFTGYLVPWQGYVFNPSLMLLAIRKRSLPLGALGLALQLVLFGETGYRAFLFLPLLLIAFYMIAMRRDLTAMALSGALAVIAVALALYAALGAPLVPSLLIDRLLVIPAQIHYWYYDFFGIHHAPLLQLSQSIFSALSEAPFHSPIAEVIGWTYMNSNGSANVGLFGDAFANFGFLGCGIFSILLALVLVALDAAARGVHPRVATALIAMPAFELINSGLLTTLLTEGLAVAILVLWVMSEAPGRGGRRSARTG